MTSRSPALTGIDCHAHVMRMDAPLAASRHSAPQRDVDVGEFVALLDRHGLSHGVLTAPSFYGTDNRLLLDALARYPARLRGTATVTPDASDDALEELASGGIVGLRLNWIRLAKRPDPSSPAYRHLFAAASRLSLHIELYLEGRFLPDVLPVLLESGLDVVLDHFGAPDPAEGVAGEGFQCVLAALRTRRCWVKLSAPYRLGGAEPQRYVDALMADGPDRLVWASDWPWISHEAGRSYQGCLDDLHRWVPDARARRVILCDTAAVLFRFPAFAGDVTS